MTKDPSELSPEERHRMNLMGLVLFLRQMTVQLVEANQMEEARGLVDSIESLQVKTKGNTDREEDQMMENVLFELRLAVVRGPEKKEAAEPAAAAAESAEASAEPAAASAESAEKPAGSASASAKPAEKAAGSKKKPAESAPAPRETEAEGRE